jgi:glycosyltransferase involved in cell wall biosynthesis
VVPEVRSVDFERSRRSSGHTVIYVGRYPDLDAASVRGDNHRVGLATAWRWAFRADWTVVELAEPLWLRALPLTASIALAVRAADRLRRRRTRLVCYAMENSDAEQLLRGLPSWARPLALGVVRLSAGRWFDRVAFASATARRRYAEMGLLSRRCHRALYEDLQEPCATCVLEAAEEDPVGTGGAAVRRPRRMTFLGALETRKGLADLLAAWRRGGLGRQGWELAVAGAGPLRPELDRAAQADGSIRPLGLVGRAGVHRVLRETEVVVLPSRREGRWREQIGMSIVEGLAHGCHVVACADTGLADWLRGHGHTVLPDRFSEVDLSRALCAVATARVEPGRVLATLPSVGGRVAAEAWMYQPEPATPRGES